MHNSGDERCPRASPVTKKGDRTFLATTVFDGMVQATHRCFAKITEELSANGFHSLGICIYLNPC
jgi:hypothetical protein